MTTRSFFIEIRGVERAVFIDHDYGPEPDTGAHDVDWHVDGPDDLTPTESDRVVAAVYQYLYDSYGVDDDYD